MDDDRKRRNDPKIVGTSVAIKSAVTDDCHVPTNSPYDLEEYTSLEMRTKNSEKLFKLADVGTAIATGYEEVDHFSRPPKKRGGTIIYIKSGLQISPLDISRCSEEVHCEVWDIRVTIQNRILHNALEYCSARTDVMFLCGDINVNYFDSGSNDRKLLSDLLGCFNLTVTSVLSTRLFVNAGGSKTTSAKLDQVLTNSDRHQFEVEVVKENLSDHKIMNEFLLCFSLIFALKLTPEVSHNYKEEEKRKYLFIHVDSIHLYWTSQDNLT
ncbi:hypothetical protein WA026_012723 [Henosepilachna vigintioctopunctata]|uniref:Endonuclease/exonuclease/phosphatase domain-containing protein n=1 Tax=Henosepilachna vigintioctopunctata TaxID=420089 RepID=A0AAW1U0J2_9CUCU